MTTKAIRITAVGTACALACAGAGAGIAGSTAATPSKTTTSKSSSTQSSSAAAKRASGPRRGGPRFGRHGERGGRPVHSEQVVLNKGGDKYIAQTVDNGVVKSTSGTDLVITEGTTAVPYKDVTVSVPSDATIVRNGATTKLSDLKAGDEVFVASSSDGTMVFARDASFRPHHGGPRPGGPGRDGPGRDGPDGPPPAPPTP